MFGYLFHQLLPHHGSSHWSPLLMFAKRPKWNEKTRLGDLANECAWWMDIYTLINDVWHHHSQNSKSMDSGPSNWQSCALAWLRTSAHRHKGYPLGFFRWIWGHDTNNSGVTCSRCSNSKPAPAVDIHGMHLVWLLNKEWRRIPKPMCWGMLGQFLWKSCDIEDIEIGQGSKACSLVNMSQQFVSMYNTLQTHSGCAVLGMFQTGPFILLWKTISTGENLSSKNRCNKLYSGAFYTLYYSHHREGAREDKEK